MQNSHLQDRFSYALGKAAGAIGDDYTLLRPQDAVSPMKPCNKKLRIRVAFAGPGQGWRPPPAPEEPFWSALLDTAYTQAGDYLRGPLGTFFIGSQAPFLPTVCIQTNRSITIMRPDGSPRLGTNTYGGVQSAELIPLLEEWPASVLIGRAGGRRGGELPGEPGPPTWSILMPKLPDTLDLRLSPGDLIADDRGFSAILSAIEPTAIGWRMTAVEAIA